MKKGQINALIAFGMGLVAVWALGRVFLFVGNIGTRTNLRTRMMGLIRTNEENRRLLSQERQYALDKALLLTGIEGGMNTSECGYIDTSKTFPFLPTRNGKIKYWRKDEEFCIPKKEEVRNSVERKLETYFSNVIPSDLGISGSISEDLKIKLERSGEEYKGKLKIPMLEKTYKTTLYCSTGNMQGCNVNQQVVRFENGSVEEEAHFQEAVVLENRSIKVIGIEKIEIPLNDKKENKVNQIEAWANCKEINGEQRTFFMNNSTTQGDSYWYEKDEGCYKSLGSNVKKLTVGEILNIGDQEYEVVLLSSRKVYLEPFSYKVVNLERSIGGDTYIHFIPKEMTFNFPEADILMGQEGLGNINYKFIPSQGAELCMRGESTEKYSSRICGSLLTEANRIGSLPLLYSYAKDYANGTYGEYRGYQNFALDRWVTDQLDAVNMKTLKVRKGGDIVPKWGWKYNLINNLGIQGTKYEWDTIDKACIDEEFSNGEKYWVEICNDDNYPGSLNPILRETLKENFKDYFKQIFIAELNTLTNVNWNIGVKEFDVKVTHMCKDKKVQVHYESNYTYNSSDRAPNQTIGLPEQLRFGYQDDLTLKSSHSDLLCKAKKHWGNNTGDPCVVGMDVANCKKNVELGVKLQCTQSNKCCPPGYTEQIQKRDDGDLIPGERIEEGEEYIPCCNLIEIESLCSEDPKGIKKKTYECYKRGETSLTTFTVSQSDACGVTGA